MADILQRGQGMAKRKSETPKKNGGISRREVRDVEELSAPRTPVIYEVVRRLGEEEMERPASSLWWSAHLVRSRPAM